MVAEALDAIFDVFAEDHLNPGMREIGLVDKLQALVPSLKQKVSCLAFTCSSVIVFIPKCRDVSQVE